MNFRMVVRKHGSYSEEIYPFEAAQFNEISIKCIVHLAVRTFVAENTLEGLIVFYFSLSFVWGELAEHTEERCLCCSR